MLIAINSSAKETCTLNKLSAFKMLLITGTGGIALAATIQPKKSLKTGKNVSWNLRLFYTIR